MARKKNSNENKKIPKEEKNVPMGKEEKLYLNLLRNARQYFLGKNFVPSTEAELINKLKIESLHIDIFKKILKELISEKVIAFSNGRYVNNSKQEDVVKGVISMHPKGFGFVQPSDNNIFKEDIFIPKHLTQNAVDGDTVEVVVNEVISEKGPEGKVISILDRGRTHIAGIVSELSDGKVFAHAPLLGQTQKVLILTGKDKDNEFKLKIGDRLVMEVQDWGSKETHTTCKVSHKIGHISDPSSDIAAAIEEFELRSDFPTGAINEAKAFGQQVSLKEIKNREDLRSIETFTIDPDTAKDYDDALSLRKDERGHYHLIVSIADVSYYVHPGSELDKEAYVRCNSTYLPGFVLPMLPHELSSNLCSLKENVNRLTVSVHMEFNPAGDLVNYRHGRSVIRSAKRMTYKEAKLILDGKKKSKHEPTLRLMVELCNLLKKKRYERGSIEFSLPELVVKVDEKGEAIGTEIIEYDITHQLVEEFMLKANEVVATHISSQGKHLSYRIHDVPAPENMKEFAFMARAFGFELPENPSPADLQKLFDKAVNTPYGQYLASSYIRRMRLAIYSPDNIGHYGLSLSHYCHFTSPIRRYVDLVVHRILLGEQKELEALEEISEHCSEQERISAKAENNVVLLKKLRLLEKIHASEPEKNYQAVITRVKPFGIYFEVLELMLEGFAHISELGDDYFVYDEANMRMKGTYTSAVFKTADKAFVKLESVDLILLESKWKIDIEYQTNYRKTDQRYTEEFFLHNVEDGPEKPGKKTGKKENKGSVADMKTDKPTFSHKKSKEKRKEKRRSKGKRK